MDFIDYYKVLELDKNASEADIKKAYRRLARKYHPDLNPNDNAAKVKFQQINEANEVLIDPEKRKKYDQYGKDWKHSEAFEQQKQQRGDQSRTQNYDFGGSGFSSDDFSDFFSSMFDQENRGSSRHTKFRGNDLNAELQLDIRDVYNTHKRTLTVNGKSIRINIPAGIENGQTIKINNHGSAGVSGGPNGDLYITFLISNSTGFKREKNDLYTDVDIDLFTAILGGEITVDSFDSKVKLSVKPETQNGTRIKLKGKGFAVYKKEGEYGDLFITYKIKMPTDLTEKEKELFRELQTIRQNGK